MRFKNESQPNTSGLDVITLVLEERVAGAALIGIFSCVSLCANLALWLIVCRDQASHTTANYLLLNLTVSDILMAAVSMPLNAWTILMGERKFSNTVCEMLNYLNILCLCSTVISLAAVTVNRYVRICQPDYYDKIYTRLGLALNLFCIWTLSAVLSFPPLLYERPNPKAVTFLCTGNCEAAFVYCATFALILIEGTFVLMITLYVSIFSEFGRIQHAIAPSTQPVNPALLQPEPYQPRLTLRSLMRYPKDDSLKPWCLRRASVEMARESGCVRGREDESTHSWVPANQFRNVASIDRTNNSNDAAPTDRITQSDIAESTDRINNSNDAAPTDRNTQSDNAASTDNARPRERLEDTVVLVTNPSASIIVPAVEESWKDEPSVPCEMLLGISRANGDGRKISDLRRSMSFLGLHMELGPLVQSEKLEAKKRQLERKKKEKTRAGRLIKWSKWSAEEKEVTTSIVIIIAAFVVCYTPIWILLILLKYNSNIVPKQVIGFCWMLVYLNCALNPFIYGGQNPHIRDGYRRVWREIRACCRCGKRSVVVPQPHP